MGAPSAASSRLRSLPFTLCHLRLIEDGQLCPQGPLESSTAPVTTQQLCADVTHMPAGLTGRHMGDIPGTSEAGASQGSALGNGILVHIKQTHGMQRAQRAFREASVGQGIVQSFAVPLEGWDRILPSLQEAVSGQDEGRRPCPMVPGCS
jgi:hypothetical protein